MKIFQKKSVFPQKGQTNYIGYCQSPPQEIKVSYSVRALFLLSYIEYPTLRCISSSRIYFKVMGLQPSRISIPLSGNKPDNVIFSIKVIFQHFPYELLHFFVPKHIFLGGFSGYKVRAMVKKKCSNKVGPMEKVIYTNC